ncbi:hypothetical protein GCM10007939_08330 [Amylibacter marinus]|uniref:Uncharacterized protein n=1 Tax=Amylibacter marinus TaxID=1475483 RepID=A0ABQ5VT05_9RHOB|nr:hypothetical protein [Amylibacter marinus]GLQ34550.1 hypothetical protein GCM10007939_08330 [Amylibacter marinus]
MTKVLIAGLIVMPLIMVLAAMNTNILGDFDDNADDARNEVQKLMDATGR